MKKCQSLGCILDKKRLLSGGDFTDDEVDLKYSLNYSYEESMETINDSFDDNVSSEIYAQRNLGVNFPSKKKDNNSIDGFKQFSSEVNDDVDELSTDLLGDSGCMSSDIPTTIARSLSVNNLKIDEDSSGCNVARKIIKPRSRSFEFSHYLNEGMVEFHVGDEVFSPKGYHHKLADASSSYVPPQESDEDRRGTPSQEDSADDNNLSDTSGGLTDGLENNVNNWRERSVPHVETPDYVAASNEKRASETDDVKLKNLQQDSPIENSDELSPKEFSTRRLEEWIGQIDIGDGSLVEEAGDSSYSSPNQEPQVEASIPVTKPDARGKLAMEVAYNYISSLNAASAAAHMANIGLVAVPFLSGFSSLRMLNLSGNSIVRITGGSLPRGLHMLNLSKNNIATIEGLRDLTRLRVLDLSYNRIVRIGHGLALCSSLKELYLSGNKISEVDGLHRLLKLNILDLRGNKISTAKGLGQLAANYSSLQSINLEGNPAQRNVGDEQLKKYLLTLLPNLVYYNKHVIKASGMKEISDRPRSAIARGTRSEHDKLMRRGSRGSGIRKSTLNHARSTSSLASLLKQSKGHSVEGRHSRLPPLRSKTTNYPAETDKKLKNDGALRANGELDRWEALVARGLGGSMAAVLSRPQELHLSRPRK